MSAFNGTGTFVISGTGLPFVTGTTISSTVANQLNTDLATGLSTTLTKDGQSTPTGNIKMGGFKLTGLGAPTASGDALSFGSSAGYTNTSLTNSLVADVALNNTANYFTGPTVAQGTTGTWFASGTVTVQDASAANYLAKLWDGTTVIASTTMGAGAGTRLAISLSGLLSSPEDNIRISVRDASNTTGNMLFNNSGNSKDCTLTVVRIG